MEAAEDTDTLNYIVNHVFFPIRLPQRDDYHIERDLALCDIIIDRAVAFQARLSHSQAKSWVPIVKMMQRLRKLQSTSMLDQNELRLFMGELALGDALVIPVRAQNACFIIHKVTGNVIFESFEVDPPNSEVMSTIGRLVRSFPGPAISVPDTTAMNHAFQRELASFLVNMDVDILETSAPSTKKAKSAVLEARETANPHYITDLLTAILRGLQGSHPADIERIEKHTRNDILWKDAYKPWRRSSLWLIVRVALQTILCRSGGTSESGKAVFKAFMIFLMASVPLLRDCSNLVSDSLYCMRAKLARRLRKISADAPGFVVKEALHAMKTITIILDSRWDELQSIQKRSWESGWNPDRLDIEADTYLSLCKSREYLCSRLGEARLAVSTELFQPATCPRLTRTLQHISGFTHANLSRAFLTDSLISLMDLEQFVAIALGSWVENHLLDAQACKMLADCITLYADTADKHYAGNPENESIKVLTILQMWVALDRLTTAQHPLLLDYSPEIPQGLAEALLLRDSLLIERLRYVQSYLSVRHTRARNGSVFQKQVVATSFTIRYFESSEELQVLKAQIEDAALVTREAKCSELQQKREKYESLLENARSLDHETSFRKGKESHRLKKCPKCRFEREANGMDIQVHEWPLPQSASLAKAVVFELRCPSSFQTWRATTYTILYDLCRPSKPLLNQGDPPVTLGNYGALRQYIGDTSRVVYASSTKPFAKSHYASQKIPSASEKTICVNNGLNFALFDTKHRRWVIDSFTDCGIEKLCMYILPSDGPYRLLQAALETSTHASNIAISQQAQVPTQISLHEYMAFSTLRCGPNLQWLNIARELRAGVLSFSRLEVQMLVAQAAMQMGPFSSSGNPDWHVLLKCPRFSATLLAEMIALLSSIEGNWLHVVTLQTLILLGTQLLNFAQDECVVESVCIMLRRSREIAFAWVQMISKLIANADSEESMNDLRRRLCHAAITCRATYDVNAANLNRLLCSDPDVTKLVYCSIVLHDNSPPDDSPDEIQFGFKRDIRLSHSLASTLCETGMVLDGHKGLDDALMAIWSEYRPGSEWKQLPYPNDRWVTTSAPIMSSQTQFIVHLHLLDGALLINGKPLKRLPSSIVTHPTYLRILGPKILDIIPSDIPGMDFATRTPVAASEFHLYFKLQGQNLVIHAKRGSEIYELIPHNYFNRDFPADFIEKYTHWLRISPCQDTNTWEIEFRPLENKWSPSSGNWRLFFSPSPTSASRMQQGSTFLIDVRSATFGMISNRLKSLEVSDHIHVTTMEGSGGLNLSSSLPRYKLSFFLNPSLELESRNFRDMIVDFDQFTGTMVVLDSQLVLRQRNPDLELFRSRSVIIPFGEVQAERKSHSQQSVRIRIDTGNLSSVHYFKYDIDTNLGSLVGTTLLADLYKIYLHASTAQPLPDPLTGRTGTEEALSALGSAKCLSFQTLGDEEHTLLYKIADLAPERSWYPEQMKVMQSIRWHKIGPLAQHWGFYFLVRAILQFNDQLSIFRKDDSHLETSESRLPGYNFHLHERTASRHYNLYPSDYAVYVPAPSHDKVYPPPNYTPQHRSGAPSGNVIQLSANVSAMVQNWPCSLSTVTDLWSRIRVFQSLFHRMESSFSLSYSRLYLNSRIQDLWLPLYDLCRKSERSTAQYRLTFSLSALSYQSPDIQDLLPTLLAFATIPEFYRIDLPRWDSYDLSVGIRPDKEKLVRLLATNPVPLAKFSSGNLTRRAGEKDAAFRKRCETEYRSAYSSHAETLAERIASQWPCKQPSWSGISDLEPRVIELSSALKDKINGLFQHWYRNMFLRDHVQKVQGVLDRVRSDSSHKVPACIKTYNPPMLHSPTTTRYTVPSLADLLRRNAPRTLFPPPKPLQHSFEGNHQNVEDPNTLKLKFLFKEFIDDTCALRRRYGWALDNSRKSQSQQRAEAGAMQEIPFSLAQLKSYREECEQCFNNNFSYVIEVLSPRHYTSRLAESAAYTGGQWPRLTLTLLLSLLSKTSTYPLSDGWRTTIVILAQSLMRYQRAQRLVRYQALGLSSTEDFWKEYNNDIIPSGSENYAEWLLVQIEGNFLLRPVQRLVAEEMMSPRSGENTLLQLNMGEGKSSVIVPIVSSALADGKQLARVVVLKPLARQMFNLLSRRLSGLVNRRIFYLPFSRDVKAVAAGEELQALFESCRRERGILVVQPEHMLSFKLMGIDMAVRMEGKVARTLLSSQSWLFKNSRDILDESDEILSVKYQLVYTSGMQEPLEDHPDRWMRIQEILHCARKHAVLLQEIYPDGLKVEQVEEAIFPIIRILETAAGVHLSNCVAEDILNQDHFRLLPERAREAALRFITCQQNSGTDALVLDHYRETGLWRYLLLLRGLLGSGILRFILQNKRWRVDYGLDLTRTLLAVPYRAKDVPTLRSDFGHPDVAIGLTCLSYYYGGLQQEEVILCFRLLSKLDNPALEYEAWVTICGRVPSFLHEIIGVNIEDQDQLKMYLVPLFSKNHAVIDFYLSNVVFPKEAKQFPRRLAASSWDLAEKKGHVTTGFSGTNDNRFLLPTMIDQTDPLGQLGTNAKVLGYLLRPENNHYFCLDWEGQTLSSRDFLRCMVDQSPPVRVLLDVGAQMLDLQSSEIASTWLSLTPDIEAIVFFDDQDQLVVMSRDGTTEFLESSQFNQKLDVCGIYLDDAHTRGTDLSLPKHFRAAVTLGPHLTKDRLVQGCMRMRKLGHGQSLIFLAPQEVDRAIRALVSSNLLHTIRPLDIVRWVMVETCDYVQHHLAHWAQQGVEYKKRHEAWTAYASDMTAIDAIQRLRSSWEEPDARTLEEMYDFAPQRNGRDHPAFAIPELCVRLKDLGVSSVGNVKIDEEQEREVSHEMERERQVERPRKAEPATHHLHHHVRLLVNNGILVIDSPAFVPLFSPLRHLGDHEWSPTLLATKDFATTILGSLSSAQDYHRPVHWLLSLKLAEGHFLIALSPYEANELLPLIQENKFVHLHMYAPRVTHTMKTFEDLDFFCIPPLPTTWTPPSLTDIAQLNLFAGQLYIKDYAAYMHLRMVLGLVGDETKGENGQWWESDGFVKPQNRRGPMEEICKLSTSPLPFLKDLVGLRRKGVGYQSTHLGKILHGGLLTRDDFEKYDGTRSWGRIR